MANANELIATLGEEGVMKTLNVKVSPEVKVCVADLRKRTGKGISEIVQRALDSYFEGYELLESE